MTSCLLFQKINKNWFLLIILISNFDGFQNDPHSLAKTLKGLSFFFFTSLTIKISSNELGLDFYIGFLNFNQILREKSVVICDDFKNAKNYSE